MEHGQGSSSPELREWSYDFAPTQIKLVELLQFVLSIRKTATPVPIAVVVSAWDLIKGPTLPISWIESHLPLLSQFLTSNADAIPSRVYGVSALGGDLKRDLEVR
jgi:hypothetical protein